MDNEIVKVDLEGVFAAEGVMGFRLGYYGADGWGELQIKTGDDSRIFIDSEHMSKEFVMAVLTKLVNDAELVD